MSCCLGRGVLFIVICTAVFISAQSEGFSGRVLAQWALELDKNNALAPINPRPIGINPEGIPDAGYIFISYLANGSKDEPAGVALDNLKAWLYAPGMQTTAPIAFEYTAACKPICDCIFYRDFDNWELGRPEPGPESRGPPSQEAGSYFAMGVRDCLYRNLPSFSPDLRCRFDYANSTSGAHLESVGLNNQCPGGYWNLSSQNWMVFSVDKSFQQFIDGGADRDGYWWLPADPNKLLSEELGLSLLNQAAFLCGLEAPCTAPIVCSNVGWHQTFGKPILTSHWGYMVLASLEHLNYQLVNQYNAIQGAAISSTLVVFNIDDFFPVKDQQINLLNALTGLGTIFGAAAGFTPIIGPGLGAAGSILPAIGTYISRAIPAGTAMAAQKDFAPKVDLIYRELVRAVDKLASILFAGDTVEGVPGVEDLTLPKLLTNGSWVDPDVLTQTPDVEDQMRVEILSRSIDSLWKTPTSNKMWVLFVDLGDDLTNARCISDLSGPQDMKYCNDGGVYYTYNYRETGTYLGRVDYPWGADKLGGIGLDKLVNFVCKCTSRLTHKHCRTSRWHRRRHID